MVYIVLFEVILFVIVFFRLRAWPRPILFYGSVRGPKPPAHMVKNDLALRNLSIFIYLAIHVLPVQFISVRQSKITIGNRRQRELQL